MAIDENTVIASNRFGLGAKPGDLQKIDSRPQQWLKEQVRSPDPFSTRGLSSSREAIQVFLDFRDQKRKERMSGADSNVDVEEVVKMAQSMRPMYMQHVLARSIQAVETGTPFHERLVQFWANHFAVSADKPQLLGLVGTLEVEAIRPHVNGYFTDMLMAVEKHPAMLTYLDNFQSIGPNSTIARFAGKRRPGRKFDINENLAREILELHTLGVDGGYTQQDVTRFARVISGWTYGGILPARADRVKPGVFHFNPLMHEPGTQTIMGYRYREEGIRQGEAVLRDLAAHEATARHLATKLARHFIADEPSNASIEKLSDTYLQHDGFLPAVYDTLIALDESWQQPHSKYKSPQDYVYSLFRCVNFVPERPEQVIGPLTVLGQQPFKPGSPAGWPDTAEAWSGGEALFKRVELAVSVAERLGNRVNPVDLATSALGPTLGEKTGQALNRAESGGQGLALLFASPEFQRR